jgi:flagellin FlaB
MVLVAAVAAAVLINTSGFLQQKAMATGKESTEQVASGLATIQVLGIHNGENITNLAILITPNAGSAPIDLKQATITITNGEKKAVLKYNDTSKFTDDKDITNGEISDLSLDAWNLTSGQFGIIVIQDADNSCKSDTPVINKGDIVALTVNATANELALEPRTKVTGSVVPEFGAPAVIEFTTPATYLSTQTVLELQ